MTWILMTLLAAFSQAWRNALQSQLSGTVSVAGVTLARFLIAVPISMAYLGLLLSLKGASTHLPNISAVKFVLSASVSQIIATGLMVALFKQNNYAVGAGLAKSEAIVAAILGTLFFGSSLSQIGWIGVLIGGIAVLMLSGFSVRQLRLQTALIGLACGTAFAITSLWVRQASLASGLEFPLGAAWVLMSVVICQTLLLGLYITLVERETWKKMWQRRTIVTGVGIASCIGSLGWFSAMSLQHVAYVKTLGQIEVFFMMLISVFWLKITIKSLDIFALLMLALAAILVMLT